MDPDSRDNTMDILLNNPPKADAHTVFYVPGCLEDQQEIPERTASQKDQRASLGMVVLHVTTQNDHRDLNST